MSFARKTSVVRRQERSLWSRIVLQLADVLLACLLLGGIVLAGYMAYKRITQNAFFPLRRVVLDRPLIYADGKMITDVVRDYGRVDLLQIKPRELAQHIQQLDWVLTAQVEKQWPDALKVNVVERLPILRWGNDDFLDSDTNHFHLPESPALAQLFPVSGPEGTEQTVLAMYRKLNPWLNQQGITMTRLTLDPRMNWHIGLDNTIDIVIGRDNLNERLKKLVVVYNRIIKRYQKYIVSVDLRYQDGFSVRWKEGVTPADTNQQEHKVKK